MPYNAYKEICKNCGFTFGSHLANSYYSEHYKTFFPKDSCPGHEGRMNWDQGKGTLFEGSGKYKEGE